MDGDLIQGTLQGLLQNRQQLGQQQQQAQQQHLQTMNAPAPQTSPVQAMVSEYLTKYAANPGMGWSAAAAAIGGETGRQRKADESQLMRMQAADAQEAKYAGDNLKEADLFSSRMVGSRGLSGKQPSPEQLRTVYNSSRNEAAQAAKGYNFASPEERMAWIEEYANDSVENYLSKFSTQPTGPRGAAPPQQGIPPVSEPQQGIPPVSGPQAAPAGFPKLELLPEMPQFPKLPQLGSLQQGQAAWNAQGTPRNVGLIQQEMQRPENQTPDKQLIFKQELEAELRKGQQQLPQQQQPANTLGGGLPKIPLTAATMPTGQPSIAGATKPQPVLRNIPAEEGAKAGAKGMADSYVKDYETIQAEASAASQQKAAFDALSKIKPNTGLFANAEQVVGSLFSALGQNPNDPTIQNAMKTRSAEQILSQLTNASLKAEKGVQTKTDEVRIYKEFPKTTDFQKVWDFSVKLGQERAQRKLDQRDFFESVAAKNNGTPTGARRKWDTEMSNDPITQYLGGKLIFRGDFIRAYENKYPDLGKDAAVQKWREMESEYQARGGRK